MKLDFLVIGAQKAGTTSLWQYLREHPRLCMPKAKEVPFFTGGDPDPSKLQAGMRELLSDARADSLLGKVTPSYMVGNVVDRRGIDVEMVAARIAAAFPDVKLIAILRDPIDRAVSSYMMAVRRAEEERLVNAALSDLLDPEELGNARLRPTDSNSYIVAGEYGRILGAYRAVFPADQLMVLFTEDLADDPGRLIDSVLDFLGLPTGFRPKGLDIHHFRGGRRRLLDPEAEELLFKFHREEILPYMRGSPTVHSKAFEFFLETWNVASEDRSVRVSAGVRTRLEEHFRVDARKLIELGIRGPWIAQWENEHLQGE